MEAEEQRLLISLEARLSKYEKDMARAGRITNDNFKRMEGRAKRYSKSMERATGRVNASLSTTVARLGALSKMPGLNVFKTGAIAALAPIVSISAALMKARDAITDFDKIAKDAKSTGLDSDFYQGLVHGSELAGVGVDQLNQSLIAFVRNSGMAAANKGELVEKLKVLNPELLKSIQMARSQEERFRLVADAVKDAKTETERAAIASAAFGDNGARMVELLKDGREGLESVADQARDLGLVIDRDLLTRAEGLNDQLSIATRVMDAQFKQAMIDLAPILVSTASLAADVASAIRKIVDAMKETENRSTRGLEDNLANLGMERIEIENKILKLQDRQRENTSVIAGAERKLDKEQINLRQRLTQISAEEARILAELDRRKSRASATGANTPTTPNLPPASTGSGPRTPNRNDAARDALREAEAVTELIADLQQERAEIGMTDAARNRSRTLRRAGAAATEDQRRQIGALIQAIEAERTAHEQATQSAEFFRDAAYSAFSDLVPQIETGNKALDTFLNTLMEAVAQAALLGTGPLAGMFGMGGGLFTLLGFSDGGYTGPGQKHQPAGLVHRGEYVMSKRATERIGVDNLEALHRGALKGFADGGHVGSPPSLRALKLAPANDNAPTQSVSINAPITVNGSAGTPEQNTDLAKKMREQMEAGMRTVVCDELRQQMRPGNMLSRR